LKTMMIPKMYAGINLCAFALLVIFSMMTMFMCGEGEEEDTTVIRQISVPKQINGYVLHDTIETYNSETIFDYINGAGEVYRAYNFREVIIYRFTKAGEPVITVEIFDMGSDKDAYGVFSYSREEEKTGIGLGYEYRGNLLCFWQANFYVCVMAEKGTAETKKAIPLLAETIASGLPSSGNKPKFIEFLPTEKLIEQSIRYFHTHPCLNYHYFLAEQNILNLNLKTDAILAEYEPGLVYLLAVKYNSEQLADDAYRSFVENYAPEMEISGVVEIEQGKWLAMAHEQSYVIIAFDATDGEYANELVIGFKNKLTTITQ